jgi:Transposase IS4
MFPARQLQDMFVLTNEQLNSKRYKETTKSEILKFFGIIILVTRYEWNNSSDLWAETAPSKYEASPQLGKQTGMKQKRFDEIWGCIHFSNQPGECPEGLSLETYQWMLVDDFV